MNFKDLNVIPPLRKALEGENYTTPTPIQEQAIPPILAGRDLQGCAQTGTGKTAAFAVPILQLLSGPAATPCRIRSLILTPTRELAIQIYESFRTYGRFTGLKTGVVYGGVSQRPQEAALKKGVDILVATPGRLWDLMQQRLVNLRWVEILTLDEADRMLDMGFIRDVQKIIAKTPEKKQTLFFSATMPPEIVHMTKSMLNNPAKVTIAPESPAVESVEQSVYYVDKPNKRNLLLYLLKDPAISSVLVFTRTKRAADRVARTLAKGHINAQAIHGDKSQGSRQRALRDFKDKKTRVLVATDIAARGLDISELSHVVNYDLPDVPETYIHRIGRTGRAGHSGISISFCDQEEMKSLKSIEKLCHRSIEVVEDHPFHEALIVNLPKPARSGGFHTPPQRGNRSIGRPRRRSGF